MPLVQACMIVQLSLSSRGSRYLGFGVAQRQLYSKITGAVPGRWCIEAKW